VVDLAETDVEMADEVGKMVAVVQAREWEAE